MTSGVKPKEILGLGSRQRRGFRTGVKPPIGRDRRYSSLVMLVLRLWRLPGVRSRVDNRVHRENFEYCVNLHTRLPAGCSLIVYADERSRRLSFTVLISGIEPPNFDRKMVNWKNENRQGILVRGFAGAIYLVHFRGLRWTVPLVGYWGQVRWHISRGPSSPVPDLLLCPCHLETSLG